MKTKEEILLKQHNGQSFQLYSKMEVLKAMQEYVDQSKWGEITPTSPDKPGRYLVLDDDGDVFIDILDSNTKQFLSDDANCYTHWQPLPTPPQS